MQKLAIYIPGEKVIFTLHNNIQRQYLAIRTYTLNNRNLFAITRLLYIRPSTALALYKVLCLSWSNTRYVAFIKKAISHISYVVKS
ncbi:hypothetical protein CT0861_11109 [Colletotrichum tofieldiae]|uniref:Uncharacterized protein n=1 Tax=Colletotrichum tofieldiae TaxID=708197 RepID=A0A166P8I6_9PEZI|nr:hypothetical protein CT0861_11109 [Colletotrichum tofieldiae]